MAIGTVLIGFVVFILILSIAAKEWERHERKKQEVEIKVGKRRIMKSRNK